jgi:hypothetical protein
MSRGKFLPTRRHREARPSRRVPLRAEAVEGRRLLSTVSIVGTTLQVGPGAGPVRPRPTVRQRPRLDGSGRAVSLSRQLPIVRDRIRRTNSSAVGKTAISASGRPQRLPHRL